MFKINVVTVNETVFFAAEELKKYLRMMMPEGGNVEISCTPDATDCFRLGLMQDFGLDVSDAKDTALDDIIYFNCDEKGGIIAGDNPRSVLLSVYKYLRAQGCRWIYPGIDGEFIPIQNIKSAKLRHMPSMRYRGWVSEGANSQQTFIESADFAPKLGMNVYMIQWKIPKNYYGRYYNHEFNPHREPEPVAEANMLQWRRQLEVEIAKRGLQLHDMGHGFTYEPLGIACEDGWDTEYDKKVTPEQRSLLALINGKREICYYPINTNLCMSNHIARKKMVDYIVDYAKNHGNIDYLHVWLADANNNHCECDECVKLRPADFYVRMLNELDEALTEENIDTKIVFISYMDTAWAPEKEAIKNTDRFLLMLAPITRRYDLSLGDGEIDIETKPYVRNKLELPRSLEEFIAYHKEWKKSWNGPNIAFEYHFWRPFYNDVTGLRLAKLVNDDVKGYLAHNINGMLACGPQRCHFPNGFAFYSFARSMFDMNLTFEELIEDYYQTAYGDDWRKVYEYMMKLDEAFDYKYMVRHKSSNENVSRLYNPEHVKNLEKVKEICAVARETVKSIYKVDYRTRMVSKKLLEYHLMYAELLADAYIPKAQGNDDLAFKKYEHLIDEMGKIEHSIEKYYDHHLLTTALAVVFKHMVSHTEY